MRVDIERRHLDSYKIIAQDANKALKAQRAAKTGKYKRLVEQRNISVENKKEKLAKSLHELIIKAFSINISRINDRKMAVKSFPPSICIWEMEVSLGNSSPLLLTPVIS